MVKHNNIFLFAMIFLLASCNGNEVKNNITDAKADSATAAKKLEVEVIAPLKNQIAKYPDSIALKLQLIDIADSLKLYTVAIQTIDSLLYYDRLNASYWMKKGNILKNNGDTLNALYAFDKAAQIYPSTEVQLEMSNLFAEKKDERALKIDLQVRAKNLGNQYDAYTYFLDGIYYARAKQWQQAIGSFDKSIQLNYTFADVYIEKGFVYYAQQKYTEALQVYQQLNTVSITNALGYYWQAKCYQAMNNKMDAIQNYQKAYGLDKTLLEAKQAFETLEK